MKYSVRLVIGFEVPAEHDYLIEVCRTVEFPFLPQVGLSISFSDDCWGGFRLDGLIWNMETQSFLCYRNEKFFRETPRWIKERIDEGWGFSDESHRLRFEKLAGEATP
jgi:hypothetical protein